MTLALLALHALWLAVAALAYATIMPPLAVACAVGLVGVGYWGVLEVVG